MVQYVEEIGEPRARIVDENDLLFIGRQCDRRGLQDGVPDGRSIVPRSEIYLAGLLDTLNEALGLGKRDSLRFVGVETLDANSGVIARTDCVPDFFGRAGENDLPLVISAQDFWES